MTALQRVGAQLASLRHEALEQMLEDYALARRAGGLERVRAHLPEFGVSGEEADALLELLEALVLGERQVDAIAGRSAGNVGGRAGRARAASTFANEHNALACDSGGETLRRRPPRAVIANRAPALSPQHVDSARRRGAPAGHLPPQAPPR